MGARRHKRDFPRGVPEQNPFPDVLNEQVWQITVAYYNDPPATIKSVAAMFDTNQERVRMAMAKARSMCFRRRGEISDWFDPEPWQEDET